MHRFQVWAALLMMTSGASATEYFPGDDRWETISVEAVGWTDEKIEEIMEAAGANNSSGVVILKDGRIVAERYWELPDRGNLRFEASSEGHPREDVASVQKSVTATLAAIARQKGLIKWDEPVSRYLGQQWARATAEQVDAITIRHLMSMTSGLDRKLEYKAPPGTVWEYNTGAYQNVLRVLEAASGLDANDLTRQWLTAPIGMNDTEWVVREWAASPESPDMMGLATTPRDLARFGHLILNRGRWGEEQIVAEELVDEMLVPSQQLNPAYGLLWWLNGDEGYQLPSGEIHKGRRVADAPTDLWTAAGALSRFVFIVPSANLVIVRTGAQPGAEDFRNEWWTSLARLL